MHNNSLLNKCPFFKVFFSEFSLKVNERDEFPFMSLKENNHIKMLVGESTTMTHHPDF